jgi:hypothetical protein
MKLAVLLASAVAVPALSGCGKTLGVRNDPNPSVSARDSPALTVSYR